MNLKNKIVKTLSILILTIVAICAFVACGEKTEITYKNDYAVVKVGDTVTLPDLKAMDASGKSYETSLTVKDANGQIVSLVDRKFVAQNEGKYIAEYTSKKSDPFYFSVYAYADGKEYDMLTDEFTPLTQIEWNSQVMLDVIQVKSRVTGKTFNALPSVAVDGRNISVSANTFIADALGQYTITYQYEDVDYSYTVVCFPPETPQVFIKSSANANPEYGEEFLLPYYEVAYPETLIRNTKIAVYRYGDVNSKVDLTGNKTDRFTIGTARNYTYEITVEYTDRENNPQIYTRSFVIERAYNGLLDSIDAWIEGDTLKWQDRNAVIDSVYPNNDYYMVTGYQISLDGGETFIDCQNTLQYPLDCQEMTSVLVREKRAFTGDENSLNLVAESNVIYYDGALKGTEISSFDNSLYINTVSYGSFLGWDWENKNSMSFSIKDQVDGKTGVLVMDSTGWTCLKINFAKTCVLNSGDVIGITLKFNPIISDENKHEYENSSIYLVQYGLNGNDDYPHTKGYNLYNAGLVSGEWCTIYVDVAEILSETEGSIVKGFELGVINGGSVMIDKIDYYPREDYNTFNSVMSLGQVGFSGAQYDETIPNHQEDTKNRYFYFSRIEPGNRQVEILEEGYQGSATGVLKFSYDLYGSIGIKFPTPQTVTQNLTIDIVYYYLPDNNMQFIVSGYGADSLALDLNASAKTGMWTHILVKPTDLGYTVGQTIDGIDLYLSFGEGVIYIDQITYFEQAPLSNGMVASFNYDYYSSNLVAPGAKWSDEDTPEAQLKNQYEFYFNNDDPEYGVQKTQYSIVTEGYEESDGGVLKVTYDIRGSIGVAFMESVKVTDNTTFIVRLFYGDTYLYLSKFGQDALGVKKEGLTQWEWIDVSITAAELGYQVGDIIDGMDFYFGESDGTVYIDYIKVTNA